MSDRSSVLVEISKLNGTSEENTASSWSISLSAIHQCRTWTVGRVGQLVS